MSPHYSNWSVFLAQLLVCAAVAAVIGMFVGLLLAAQTVGVEAWHDSAVPQGAFVAITPAAVPLQRRDTPVATPIGRRIDPVVSGSRAPSPSPRAVPRLAAVRPATPVRESPVGSVSSMTGTASWFAYVPGQAAAGPALRVGGWRGRNVIVCALSGSLTAITMCVRVSLTDYCQCYGTRLIDLDVRDFGKLADPSLGLQEVSIEW